MRQLFLFLFAGLVLTLTAFTLKNIPGKSSSLVEENVTYTSADGTTLKGFVVYQAGTKGKRPAVLVVPEWWGLSDYPKMRARKLAELGYIAMAIDMYGNGQVGATPDEAQKLAGPFYKNPSLFKERVEAGLIRIKTYAVTDGSKVAAIGYCFGGSAVLNSAKLGADLKGVVSFHGGLAGPAPDKALLKAKILVCHGGADKFESPQEIATFKKGLDSIQAPYTFKVYPNATHAFTNPAATEVGKKFNMPIMYNAAADKASWNDMQVFLKAVFR